MYTVSKGPSKFVAKTRIGIPSHVDNTWDISKKCPEALYHDDFTSMMTDVSKPVFVQLSNKKLYDMRSQETLTPEHEEMVKFVSENWSSVACKSQDSSTTKSERSPMYYKFCENGNNNSCNQLKDFVPFDLDSWWGKRIYNTITKSVP